MTTHLDKTQLNYLSYLSLEERLYRHWYDYNQMYFAGKLSPTVISVDDILAPCPGRSIIHEGRSTRKAASCYKPASLPVSTSSCVAAILLPPVGFASSMIRCCTR